MVVESRTCHETLEDVISGARSLRKAWSKIGTNLRFRKREMGISPYRSRKKRQRRFGRWKTKIQFVLQSDEGRRQDPWLQWKL